MDNKSSSQKISRRDAMKILGVVAGATALASVPSKWTKPGLDVGVLPAHAATSGGHTIAASAIGPDNGNFCQPQISSGTITPPTPGILLKYIITPSAGLIIVSPALTGTQTTGASGSASLSIVVNTNSFKVGDTITVTWSFANPSDGTSSDSVVITDTGGGC